LAEGKDFRIPEMLPKIDEARSKIARFLTPAAPAWIATHGRFGPRISPQ
jgi:hypothetical protein